MDWQLHGKVMYGHGTAAPYPPYLLVLLGDSYKITDSERADNCRRGDSAPDHIFSDPLVPADTKLSIRDEGQGRLHNADVLCEKLVKFWLRDLFPAKEFLLGVQE